MATESSDLVAKGGIPPSDFHADPSKVALVANDEVMIPDDIDQRLVQITEDFVISNDALEHAASALVAGHLILQGPPGTGKTELAQRLADVFGVRMMIATAHADWTTYDVIGRQELRVSDGKEEVVPVDGYVTEAVLECAAQIVEWEDSEHREHTPQAVWLLVDELNRSFLDRAFGELFTALASDSPVEVTLSHRPGATLVVPRRFRIIGTLNSIDRQFVNSLSQGLKRRFSFVTIDVPPAKPAQAAWSRTPAPSDPLAVREYAVVLDAGLEAAVRRLPAQKAAMETRLAEIEDRLGELFDLVGRMRLGGAAGEETPYLPIGTATLIDIVETYLIDMALMNRAAGDRDIALDWAVALRVAPLFEAETIEPDDLVKFADALAAPFDKELSAELRRIAAAGLYAI